MPSHVSGKIETKCAKKSDRKTSRNSGNAARERSRVRTLRNAYIALQKTLPAIPPDTKLSKLDILVLAATYIFQLTCSLDESAANVLKSSCFQENRLQECTKHKKWPMRSRCYTNLYHHKKEGSVKKRQSTRTRSNHSLEIFEDALQAAQSEKDPNSWANAIDNADDKIYVHSSRLNVTGGLTGYNSNCMATQAASSNPCNSQSCNNTIGLKHNPFSGKNICKGEHNENWATNMDQFYWDTMGADASLYEFNC